MADEKVVLDGDLSLRNVLDGDLSLRNVLDGIAGTVIRVEVEVGLDYIVFNPDYTITFVMTNGEQYTTGSIRGAQGERGVSGVYIGDDEPTDEDMNLWVDTDASDEFIYVKDVQVNGTSVLQNGVANIPIASTTQPGVVRADTEFGTGIYGNRMFVAIATEAQIKAGRQFYRPICPDRQHQSVFYGLAKAAGDVTQSASSNSVGTYTDEAKSSIQTMLGVPSEDEVITDVQINGTSIIQDGVANISYITSDKNYGLTKLGRNASATGLWADDRDGILYVATASVADIKTGTNRFLPITPIRSDASTFYGLAKAAGDTTQSQSDNSVGTYTDEAKTAIRTMLGLQDLYDDYSSALTALGVI